MPRKKTEPKSPSRSRAMATRARDARGRVLPKTVPTVPIEALPAVCPFCGGVVPCLADRERQRLVGRMAIDTSSGLTVGPISDVGHLTGNSDILVKAKVRDQDRLIPISRLKVR
jgi:hypothetical protein